METREVMETVNRISYQVLNVVTRVLVLDNLTRAADANVRYLAAYDELYGGSLPRDSEIISSQREAPLTEEDIRALQILI
jgi:hypothetical protein